MKTTNLSAIFSTADAAEAAFYSAFSNCELAEMELVWSEDEIVCIHPGSDPLIGHSAVMRSWKDIFSNAESPSLQIKLLSRTEKDSIAVHVVEEHIYSGNLTSANATIVLATNIYQQEGHGWRLLLHHAALPSRQYGRSNTSEMQGQHRLQ